MLLPDFFGPRRLEQASDAHHSRPSRRMDRPSDHKAVSPKPNLNSQKPTIAPPTQSSCLHPARWALPGPKVELGRRGSVWLGFSVRNLTIYDATFCMEFRT